MVDMFTGTLIFGGGMLVAGMMNKIFMMKFNKPIYNLNKSIKKGKPIVLLEDYNKVFLRSITSMSHNLAQTDMGELLIVPKGSVKHVANLNAVPIIHGDYYKSVGSTHELRLFIEEVKSKYKLSDEEIAEIFSEIETNPSDVLKSRFSKMKNAKKPKDVEVEVTINIDEDGVITIDSGQVKLDPKTKQKLKKKVTKNDLKTAKEMRGYSKFVKTRVSETTEGIMDNGDYVLPEKDIRREKYDIFVNMPSQVKDWIYTGVNKVTLEGMMDIKIKKDKLLNKKKQLKYFQIGIMILFIMIGIAFFMNLGGADFLTSLIGGGGSAPAPTGLPSTPADKIFQP